MHFRLSQQRMSSYVFPPHERALFIVHHIRGQVVSKGGGVHTHSSRKYSNLLFRADLTSLDIIKMPNWHSYSPFWQLFSFQRIDWSCSLEDKNNCDLKGKSDPECQNYIRVLSVIGKMHFLWRRIWVVNGWMFHFVVSLPQLMWWNTWSGDHLVLWFPFLPKFTDIPLWGKWL